MPRMIVSLMRVLWLTCVMVRPAWLRASANASPMLTPRLPLPSRTARRPGGSCAVTGCVWAQSAGPISSVGIPRHAAKATGPAQSILPAPQRVNHFPQIIRPDPDVPGLGSFTRPDDPPALQKVHEPARLGEPHPQLALQHRGGAELRANDKLSGLHKQFKVIADVGVDLPLLAFRYGHVLPV